MHRVHHRADAGRFCGALFSNLDPYVSPSGCKIRVVVDLISPLVEAVPSLHLLKHSSHVYLTGVLRNK